MKSSMNLLDTYPHIAKEWHPSLNAFSPSEVAPHTHKRAWWLCAFGHEWDAIINNRTSNGATCPYCSGKLPTETTSFGFIYSDLVKEWHPTKNKMTPFDVTPFTHSIVSWKCEYGHEWKAPVSNRSNSGSGCPYCQGNLSTPETCLAAVYPEIALEWHPTKNDRSPQEVTKSGAYKAWWKCSICNHEWRTSINSRTNLGSGCPQCHRGLSTSAPEIRLWAEMTYVFGNTVKNRFKDLGFELDVFIPDLKIGIEYDGFKWHKDRLPQDTKKYEQAKKNNIFLIRVSEIPEAPADKVFISKNVTLHLMQRIVSYLQQKFDPANKFVTANYLKTRNFQNQDLFKRTYDAVRKR